MLNKLEEVLKSGKPPFFFLGDSIKTFKQNYSRVISSPLTDYDFCSISQEVLNNYQNGLFVLELVDYFPNVELFKTFLSTCRVPLIILISENYINKFPELLSYAGTIVKGSSSAKSELLTAIQGQSKWKEEIDKSNILKFCAKESPELYYLKNKFSMNKYIDLFSIDNAS